VFNEYTNKGKMNKGKLLLFCLPLHRRLAIIDISGVLSFFELVSHLKTGYLACRGTVGLMVSALDSGSSGPGSRPGQGHCVVFLGKTLDSLSASLYPHV